MSTIKVDSIKSADGNTDLLTLSNGAVSGVIGGRRNLIINGAMQVAQRGTSFTSAGYTLDRWQMALSGATGTTTQESFTLGQTDVPGAEKYLKLAVTTGDNNGGLYHNIEAKDAFCAIGQQVTLSYYAKGTSPTDGLEVLVAWYDGSNVSKATAQTTTLTSTWTKYTHTFTTPSISGLTLTNAGSRFEVRLTQKDADIGTAAWELNLANVQLEVGSVATPFEHRSYGEELALCQRYFQKSAPQSGGLKSTSGLVFTRDGTSSTVSRYIPVRFVQTMRTTPTITIYDTNLNTGYLRIGTTNGQTANISAAGDQSMMVYGPSGISHYETVFGYYLDAEL